MPSRIPAGTAMLATLLLALFFTSPDKAWADGRRVALVIGNAHYQNLPGLDNPGNDVENVGAVLRASGFDVVVGVDLQRVPLEQTIERFFRSLGKSDVSLFYYSGHGVQIAGKNYIIPVDASLKSPYDIETQTINLDTILDFMRTNTKTQLVFLDACRNNPFGTKAYWVADKLQPVSVSAGLAGVKPSVGTLIAFATDPDSVSFDGTPSGMSPFSGAFVKRAPTPNEEIRSVLTQVRRDVVDATGGRQVPWENSSLVDDFYLFPRRAPPRVAPMTKVTAAAGEMTALDIPAPQVDGSAALSVTFDLLPDSGKLVADGHVIEANKDYPESILRDVAYDADSVAVGASNVASFTVSDNLSQTARGLIAIAVAKNAPKNDGADRVAWSKALDQTTAAIEQDKVSVPIGVGPVPIVSQGKTAGIELASLDGDGPAPQVELTDAPPTGVLVIGDRKIGAGAILDTRSLSQLSYQPQVGAENQTQTVKVQVMAAGDVAPRSADLTVTPVIDDCDKLAGEPFDLQGVTKGVLPNEIRLPDALDACQAAVQRYPDVPRFLYEYGRAQLANRDVPGALHSINGAAKSGYQRAIYELGNVNGIGIGQPANLVAANKYYKQSSDFGDPYGMLAYGRNLFYGRGVKQDVEEGLKLMIKSAELGHTYAMNELGAIFTQGTNEPANPARGIAYYKQGAVRDDIYSYNNLGLAFLRGQGVVNDDKAAFEMFTKAMAGGHPGAPANLGVLYLTGRGVDKDVDKARSLFETSADRGDWYGAMMRGDAALSASQDRPAQAEAARFYAMSVAFDRDGGAPDAKKKLAALPKAAKQAALDDLMHGMPGTKLAGPLDEKLQQAALAEWKRKNPRMDLF